jgi:hypothetical protein
MHVADGESFFLQRGQFASPRHIDWILDIKGGGHNLRTSDLSHQYGRTKPLLNLSLQGMPAHLSTQPHQMSHVRKFYWRGSGLDNLQKRSTRSLRMNDTRTEYTERTLKTTQAVTRSGYTALHMCGPLQMPRFYSLLRTTAARRIA